MPRIVTEGQSFPDWCQLRSFNIIRPGPEGETFVASGPMERVVAAGGGLNLRHAGGATVLAPGQFYDIPAMGGEVTVSALSPTSVAVRLTGDWPGALGGCGVFTAEDVPNPQDRGDKVDYVKTTNIDRHYHDCDEYWILLEGRAEVVVGDAAAWMEPGDCLCIGMGRLHDMSRAPGGIRAIYFETSFERQGRIGHLWEHTHGPALAAEGRD